MRWSQKMTPERRAVQPFLPCPHFVGGVKVMAPDICPWCKVTLLQEEILKLEAKLEEKPQPLDEKALHLKAAAYANEQKELELLSRREAKKQLTQKWDQIIWSARYEAFKDALK